jgi:putative transposase
LVARCTVERLMSTNGIQGAKRRGKPWRTTTPDPAGTDAPDLVERDFTAVAPDRLWVVDFTYLRTWEGVVFFAFVIDVFSRMVVGWQFATNMRDTLVLDALRIALGLRAPGADVALVHHSDRGSQYTSDDYTQTLDDHELARSLGSTGDCYDNALAESFVDSFKTELISDRVWRTHEQAELAIIEWVGWFNHVRLHSSLGDIPPIEHEHNYAAAHAPHAPIALNAPIAVNGSVAAISPQPANVLSTPLTLPAGALQRANGQQPRLSAPASVRADKLVAPHGNEATAVALPPMEMTSYGQPANGSRDFDGPTGCPQHLDNPRRLPADGGFEPPRGLPTFPQAPCYWREDRTERLKQRHVNVNVNDRGTHLTQVSVEPGMVHGPRGVVRNPRILSFQSRSPTFPHAKQ